MMPAGIAASISQANRSGQVTCVYYVFKSAQTMEAQAMYNSSFANVTGEDVFPYANYAYIYYIDTDGDPPKTLAMKVVTCIVWIEVIVGLLLNIFNIVVLRKTDALKDYRIQLTNFAVADVLLGFSAFLGLHVVHLPSSVHSLNLCRLKILFVNVASIAPLMSRVFVSVEVLLCSSVSSLRHGYRERYKFVMVTVIWVASLLLNVYHLIEAQIFSWYGSSRVYCHDTNLSHFWTLILADVPLSVVLVVSYCIIGVSSLCKPSTYDQMERSSLDTHSQSVRMLMADAIVLLVLYFPLSFYILYLTSPTYNHHPGLTYQQMEALIYTLNILVLTKCLVSPIIYYASNPSYKAAVKALCRSHCSRVTIWTPTVMYRRNRQEVLVEPIPA